jgi:hypothetical protein
MREIVLIPIVSCLLLLSGCKSSISTTQYQADFEKTDRTLESISTYTGKKQTLQLSKLNVNKELWETFPELREKRLGLGVSNRIIENLLYTNRFEFTEEKDAVVNQMLDAWEKKIDGLDDGKTKLKMQGIRLPKYIVYAEIYDFSVSYAENYDKGKLKKTNTTIMGIQIRLVNVENSQFIVASGQGQSTQFGEGILRIQQWDSTNQPLVLLLRRLWRLRQ